MTSTHSILRADLVERLSELDRALTQLCSALKGEGAYPVWVHEISDPVPARSAVRQILQRLEYQDGDDPHGTHILPALVGVSRETLVLVEEVNDAKQATNLAMRAMDNLKAPDRDPRTHAPLNSPLLKVALAGMGRSRLNRRQTTRALVILDRRPSSVSYVWARLPKIERITVGEARQRLERRLEDEEGTLAAVRADLQRIASLRDNIPLALVSPPHVHPRANIVWIKPRKKIAQKRAVMPIFYNHEGDLTLPRLRTLAASPDDRPTRLQRIDVTVDRTPFLVTLRAHRYLG